MPGIYWECSSHPPLKETDLWLCSSWEVLVSQGEDSWVEKRMAAFAAPGASRQPGIWWASRSCPGLAETGICREWCLHCLPVGSGGGITPFVQVGIPP